LLTLLPQLNTQVLSFRPLGHLGEVEAVNALAIRGHGQQVVARAGELEDKHGPPRVYTLRGQDWHIFKALELMNE
jgi:hypothetical protein